MLASVAPMHGCDESVTRVRSSGSGVTAAALAGKWASKDTVAWVQLKDDGTFASGGLLGPSDTKGTWSLISLSGVVAVDLVREGTGRVAHETVLVLQKASGELILEYAGGDPDDGAVRLRRVE